MKVVGLTGTMGSGKNSVKEIILHKFNCYHVALSDVIRGELEKKKGLMSRTLLQDMGNEMRQKYGPHILALLAIEYLPRDKDITIVDGIRNPAEIDYLKKKFGSNFSMIAVDASDEVRFERVKERNDTKDPKTIEEFKVFDARDKGINEPPYGQRVADCVARADFRVNNNGTKEQLEAEVMGVMQQIMSR
jgi:dephospho-CoA kinase